MTEQPSLFPPEAPGPPQAPPPGASRDSGASSGSSGERRRDWLPITELVVRIVVELYVGLVLVTLPWTHFWSGNHFLYTVPHLAPIALSGAARGVVTGLGLLNLWMGVSDAIHANKP